MTISTSFFPDTPTSRSASVLLSDKSNTLAIATSIVDLLKALSVITTTAWALSAVLLAVMVITSPAIVAVAILSFEDTAVYSPLPLVMFTLVVLEGVSATLDLSSVSATSSGTFSSFAHPDKVNFVISNRTAKRA